MCDLDLQKESSRSKTATEIVESTILIKKGSRPRPKRASILIMKNHTSLHILKIKVFRFGLPFLKSLKPSYHPKYHGNFYSRSQIRLLDSPNHSHPLLTITMKSPQTRKSGFTLGAFALFLNFAHFSKTPLP